MKKALFSLIFATMTSFSSLLVTSPALAQVDPSSAKGAVCAGVGVAGSDCNNPAAGEGSINRIIATVINILSILVGVVAVIFIIIGGFKYVTSSGDANSMTSAKNTIIYAIVGLIIAVLAQVIVQFVLNRVTA